MHWARIKLVGRCHVPSISDAEIASMSATSCSPASNGCDGAGKPCSWPTTIRCVSACLYALASGELPAARSHVLGTGGMVRHVQTYDAPVEIVGTEVGLLHPLQKLAPT